MTGLRAHVDAFIRFAAVGVTFSLIFAVVTATLIGYVGTPPTPTIVIVYLMCIPFAYWTQKSFAFRAETTGRSPMLIYAGTQLANLTIVSTITSQFVTRNVALDTALFFFISGAAAAISYLICRFFIFK